MMTLVLAPIILCLFAIAVELNLIRKALEQMSGIRYHKRI